MSWLVEEFGAFERGRGGGNSRVLGLLCAVVCTVRPNLLTSEESTRPQHGVPGRMWRELE